jgi:hypothetical protein
VGGFQQASRMIIGIEIYFGLGIFVCGLVHMLPFGWLAGEVVGDVFLFQSSQMVVDIKVVISFVL